ncbi:PAS domain S-box protein [Paenibacillus sp. TRM 82003]|nr:PAS domain S-box protein [Paenibacillus sp. TRM 82003]
MVEILRNNNELDRAQELYSLISKYTNDIISNLDASGKLLYVNDAVRTALGYEPDALIGTSFHELLHPDDYRHLLSQDRTKSSDVFVYRFRHVEGRYLWFETVIQRMFDASGVNTHSINVSREITARKRLEEELLAVKQQLESFMEHNADMILLFQDDRIVKTNPAFDSQTGWTLTELSDGSVQSAPLFLVEERQGALKEKLVRVERGETTTGHETVIRCKSGQIMDVIATVSPIRDCAGRVNGGSIILRDITERKKTEDLLLRSEKLTIAGQLAAGIGHEIRNPLTTLQGFLYLLPKSPEKQSQYLEIMKQELDRINLIAGELLLLAKPQAEIRKPVKMDAILNEVIELMRPEASLNDVEIVCADDFVGDAELICDKNQVKQVFINILKNAIESMSAGGAATVEMAVCPEAREVTVTLEDQGCGIPEERLRKIGEPFYSTKDKGTGLGMLVSYRIVESHSGRIDVESEIGKGTRIAVTFPTA